MGTRDELQVYTLHPFGRGALRPSGTTQFSSTADHTGTTATWQDIQRITINPPSKGRLEELELSISWDVKNSSTGSYVNSRIVGRNKGGTDVSLVNSTAGTDYINTTADCTTYQSLTYAGYIGSTAFEAVPFDMAVQIQREATTGTASGRIRASSSVKFTYK